MADDLVAVLDGATALDPNTADASTYVDTLGEQLVAAFDRASGLDSATGVARAIAGTAEQLCVGPGHAPSSTIALLRRRDAVVDLLVLGDSSIHIAGADGIERLSDDRMTAVAPAARAAYRDRLRAGGGYDSEHRSLLADLQRQQAGARNAPGGYWIAEADPNAAEHAHIRTCSVDDVSWFILSTDGAARPIEHLGIDWHEIAQLDSNGLRRLLMDLHRWEDDIDPNGIHLPRSKRHDDKALAVVQP